MLFWTVVFFTGNLYWMFLAPLKLIGDFDNESFKGLSKDQTEEKLLKSPEFIKAILVACLLFLWNVAEFIYRISALKIDPLVYPTIAILLYDILTILFGSKITKKYNIKTPSKIYRIINGLIFVTYFGYMFYVLVL